eukprot:979669_1
MQIYYLQIKTSLVFTSHANMLGPNYVKLIKRAQEVTAMFTFESSDSEVTAQLKSKIEATTSGGMNTNVNARASIDASMKLNSAMQSLQIQIFGFGLGLDKDGSGTLVAKSLEEYKAAMKFARSSRTGSTQNGMVYGIELVPWTDNTAFQVASNLHEPPAQEAITLRVPHEMIPNPIDGNFVGTGTCYSEGSNGKYCKQDNKTELAISVDDKSQEITQPELRLDVDSLKETLQKNGMHVAMMDSILQHKTFTIMNLERCIQVLRTFPDSETQTYLETPDCIFDENDQTNIDVLVTVGDLKQFLDPNGDMASVHLLNMELDEYVDMYYNPCMSALFGMNSNVVGASEPGDMLDYFMIEDWENHPECANKDCVNPTNSWNPTIGGCGPSFGQIGTGVLPTPNEDEGFCAKQLDSDAGKFVCKRNTDKWKTEVGHLNGCWKDSTPFVLIDRYCTPRLSERVRDVGFDRSKTITKNCKTKSEDEE